MNRRDKDVLLVLSSREYLGQRDLAAVCDCSLGAINASVNNLLKEKYIDEYTGNLCTTRLFMSIPLSQARNIASPMTATVI